MLEERRQRPAATVTGLDLWLFPNRTSDPGWVIIELKTDASVSGWGEIAAGKNVLATLRSLEVVRPHLVGLNAIAVEPMRARLLGLRKQGVVTVAAPVGAAINMAMADILGKLSEAPTYELLGGPTRNKARVLAPLAGKTETDLTASLHRCRQAGFRAISVPLLVPSGSSRGRKFYHGVRKLLERMREAAGEDVDFVLDCGGQLTPAEAVGIAREIEPLHVLWMDEPTRRVQHGSLRRISAETVTPLGLGREIVDNSEFQDLLREDAVDVLRPDIGRLGITQVRKAAALAETYYVAVAPRCTGGPIATAAAMHVAASIPNFFLLEMPFPTKLQDRENRRLVGGEDLEKVVDGFLPLPKGPGLGINVSRDVLKHYE